MGTKAKEEATAAAWTPPPPIPLPTRDPPLPHHPDVGGHVGGAHAAEANTQVELSACRATLAAHPAAVGKYLIHDGEAAGERGGRVSGNYPNQGGPRLKPALGPGGGGNGGHE